MLTEVCWKRPHASRGEPLSGKLRIFDGCAVSKGSRHPITSKKIFHSTKILGCLSVDLIEPHEVGAFGNKWHVALFCADFYRFIWVHFLVYNNGIAWGFERYVAGTRFRRDTESVGTDDGVNLGIASRSSVIVIESGVSSRLPIPLVSTDVRSVDSRCLK